MIGPDYQAAAMAAVLGPEHSTLFPDTLYGAWLDGALAVLAETGAPVPQDAFGIVDGHVENVTTVNAGTVPSGAVYFALTDAADSGTVIAYGTPDLTGIDPDTAVVISAGGLVMTYGEPA